MVFQVDSANRSLRGLIAICQDNAREVIEIFRKVLSMVEDLVKEEGSSVEAKLKEVEVLHRSSLEIKRTMMKELNDAEGLLINREDFFRLVDKLGEIADYTEGLGVIVGEIAESGWKVPEEVKEGLIKTSETAFETLLRLRESLLALGINSPRALDLAKEVEDRERAVDVLHRMTDLRIITSGAELPLILLLRDIVQFLEDTADRAEEAADLVRILVM
jgi:predicted phosphate transport protein (TIGR00153 family)